MINRRRVNRTVASLQRAVTRVTHAFGALWRRSVQVRVVVSTLLMSVVVLLVLGFLLMSQITGRLLEEKQTTALSQLDRTRSVVELVLSTSTGSATSTLTRLARARALLSDQDPDTVQASSNAGSYDTVLVVPGRGSAEPVVSSGPLAEVPEQLRGLIGRGQVGYQYTTVERDGVQTAALVVGTPMEAGIPDAELFMIYPMGSEENTVSLVWSTLLLGGVVLIGLLAAIVWLVTRQLVAPLRAASTIAVRFADGRLTERMPVRGEDEFAMLAVSFNDMAESLSKQIAQLEEFGDLQRQFTSDVSHELRTPLTTVRMAADMLYESRDEFDPLQRRSIELMDKELDRFETLLTELLEISRHDAGQAELAAERLNMAIPIEAALATVEPLAAEAETELVVDLPDEPVMAEIDPRRIERVLRNLLANAIDHGEGEPVTLTMRSDGDAVAITVRDRGIGLKPGEEKLVFNRFWRSDPSRVRRSGGTGLGLAISIEDARLHQGRLEAAGEPGVGSVFRLTVPLVRGHKLLGSPLPLNPGGGKPR